MHLSRIYKISYIYIYIYIYYYLDRPYPYQIHYSQKSVIVISRYTNICIILLLNCVLCNLHLSL